MAAQLGQGFQAKDTEDGARIGAAVSEIETGEERGRAAAEDLTARALAFCVLGALRIRTAPLPVMPFEYYRNLYIYIWY